MPAVSSRTSVTSAMLREARPAVPAKITSSISPPRRLRALLSPIAQRSASTTLDLPQPFGPTMPVSPGRISTAGRFGEALEPGDAQTAEADRQECTPAWPYDGDQLAERLVAHLASVFLVVDHEARSRVDLPFVRVGLLLLQDPVAQGGVGDRLVEGGAAHAGQRGHLPQLLGRVGAAGEGPAVLGREQRVDERLVALDRQVARDHGGGQRDLVQRDSRGTPSGPCRCRSGSS